MLAVVPDRIIETAPDELSLLRCSKENLEAIGKRRKISIKRLWDRLGEMDARSTHKIIAREAPAKPGIMSLQFVAERHPEATDSEWYRYCVKEFGL